MESGILWRLGSFCVMITIPILVHSLGRFPDAISAESNLIQVLMDFYRKRGKYARPVYNFSKPVPVKLGLQLVQIMDLDEKNQVLKLNLWTNYEWVDEFLVWDPTDYDGVDSIHIPCTKIWTPDIKLYNYADTRLQERRDALCIISYDGNVTWIPQGIYMSTCELDVSTFPFDRQECTLQFGSWTYDGYKLDLNLKDGLQKMITDDYFVENRAWTVIDTPAQRNTITYACCPTPYYDLKFKIIFKRSGTLYAYILILPCVLLTSLTLVLFWIPPESPIKMALGMSIYMAFFVLLLMFEKKLPPAADRIPILGAYYSLNMVLITASTFLNVFVVNVSFYGSRAPVPRTLRKVMFKFFAKILYMDNLVRPFLDADKRRLIAPTVPGLEIPNGETQKWTPNWKGSSDVLIGKKDQLDMDPQLAEIDEKLKIITESIVMFKERITDKDKKDKIAKEWKAVALIFDRIFFCIYFIIIIASLSVVLPSLFFSD